MEVFHNANCGGVNIPHPGSKIGSLRYIRPAGECSGRGFYAFQNGQSSWNGSSVVAMHTNVSGINVDIEPIWGSLPPIICSLGFCSSSYPHGRHRLLPRVRTRFGLSAASAGLSSADVSSCHVLPFQMSRTALSVMLYIFAIMDEERLPVLCIP
mmetsp:Transcript_16793/g.45758  ORF Transcript_16793/g.45758 Transcript_16793/m.45758 type:complete len:154 (-) Transcript_16793:141-602(-)